MESNITATGRVVGIVKVPGTAFLRLAYADNKQGNVPFKYAGIYTSVKMAEFARDEFVRETLEVAEEHNKTRKRA